MMNINLQTNNLRKRFAFMQVAVLPLILVFLCSFVFAGDSAKESPSSEKSMPLLAYFEGGHLYSAGKFHVLELSGTYRHMGRQYGHLMSVQMKEMYNEVVNQYAQNKVVCSDNSLEDFSMQLYRLYPRRFQELAEGMAETSAISINKIAVLNEFFDYFLRCYSSPESASHGHCSALSVWSSYTKDGKVVMGRNFDFPLSSECSTNTSR